MGHDFETRNEITVAATPEQVWEAIATGPGIDSWLMGRNEVQPGPGGTTTMAMDGFTMSATVTAWEPPAHLATRGDAGPDGSFHAFEFLVEGRDGATVVRWVHSGFIGGDDWEWEYDALSQGDPMYLGCLRTYLTYFRGRTGTPVAAAGPPQADQDAVWAGLLRGLGLTAATPGAPVAFELPDGVVVTGVVDAALAPSFLAVRTDDALLKFVGGRGHVGVGHHVYSPVPDPGSASKTWATWLEDLYA